MQERAAWLGREERGTAAGLTGEWRLVDGGSKAVWELRGLVLGRLDGVSHGSGGSSFLTASGSKSRRGGLRSSWHGEGGVRVLQGKTGRVEGREGSSRSPVDAQTSPAPSGARGLMEGFAERPP
jgi:hypothetical protein